MGNTLNREKQIEEMAIELSKVNCKPKGCGYCYLEYGTLENSCEEYLLYKKMAIALYNAGYRKSTDVAEEIEKYILEGAATIQSDNPDCMYGAKFAIERVVLPILEAYKKKYTESEKDNG